MQYLVIAHDGTDSEAPVRRHAAREAHLAGARAMKEAGTLLYGAALLDEKQGMIGSACLVDFSTHADLDAWLAADPYTTGGVWRTVQVTPCRLSV